MKKACVIGWPINHSRSPIIHGYWLKKYGIDGRYERIPVEPQNLEQFLASLAPAGFEGCNVTLPHKEAVYKLVKPADESTQRLGAVNTVFLRSGELFGTNTDSEGFMNSLASGAPGLTLQNSRAVVLGAGGAAMSVINALIAGGSAEIAVVNRSLSKAEAMCNRFGSLVRAVEWERRSDVLAECDLLVNTTSLGMKGQPDLDIDLERLPLSAVVTDIVYVPLRTVLLENAAARGNLIVEGLGMLLHQAVRGFELWFGVRPSVTTDLHDLVARDIDPGYRR
jgi:shikimate dehydrogenase